MIDSEEDLPGVSPPVRGLGSATAPRSEAARRYLAAREARRVAPPSYLGDAPPLEQDTLWRGLLRDGQMRVLVARTSSVAREIVERQAADAAGAQLLAELFCAAQLLRATIHPEESLQLAGFQQAGAGNFVVDIHDDGSGRATLRHRRFEGPGIAGGTLQVSRLRRGVGRYRSSIAMHPGETPSALVMRYLLESEQIVSWLDVAVRQGPDGEILDVVGSLVQLMPEGTHDDLRQLLANAVRAGRPLEAMHPGDPDARLWAERLLEGFHWDQVARQEVAFGCNCSAERVIALLSTLPAADLRDVIQGLEVVETTCEYCARTWSTPVGQLEPLLQPAS